MKTNTATTREQSTRLLKCGVPAESADMCYQHIDDCVNNTDKPICNTHKEQYNTLIGYGFGDSRIHITPAWSLGCLLGLMPKEIKIDGYPYRISIYYEDSDESVIGNQWCLYYKPKKHNEKSRVDDVPMYAPDLIECAVQMIIWLINYGYKLNGIEKGGEK
jgi:hypothetical protein